MLNLLFPPKCTFCNALLSSGQTDFCHGCRENIQEVTRTKINIPFIAKWTAVWYYKDNVRKSIHRFKFRNHRFYAKVYARHLAQKLLADDFCEDVDVLTWVPVSPLRRLTRGYDQSRLLAEAVGKELNWKATSTIRKIRHTKPQSQLGGIAQRRANINGAFQVKNPTAVAGKRILLLDDVLTTGATSSECARTLLIAGAKEVLFAAVAMAHHDKSNKRR